MGKARLNPVLQPFSLDGLDDSREGSGYIEVITQKLRFSVGHIIAQDVFWPWIQIIIEYICLEVIGNITIYGYDGKDLWDTGRNQENKRGYGCIGINSTPKKREKRYAEKVKWM